MSNKSNGQPAKRPQGKANDPLAGVKVYQGRWSWLLERTALWAEFADGRLWAEMAFDPLGRNRTHGCFGACCVSGPQAQQFQ